MLLDVGSELFGLHDITGNGGRSVVRVVHRVVNAEGDFIGGAILHNGAYNTCPHGLGTIVQRVRS